MSKSIVADLKAAQKSEMLKDKKYNLGKLMIDKGNTFRYNTDKNIRQISKQSL